MAKQMMFEETARAQLKDGLGQLASAVKVTMGPTGKNVLLHKSYGSPKVTKDGVSVSKEIELPEPFKNMGAKMVNQVASKTSDVVGDGTTTATVLAQAIYTEGLKYVTAGVNPVAVQRGINKASQVATDYIASASTVEVVVPSPTTSDVLLATSLTIFAPMFLKGSGNSISLLTETPSLVTFGEPQLLCSMTFLPVGPSVTLTASANCDRPSLSCALAVSSNINCFAIVISSYQ